MKKRIAKKVLMHISEKYLVGYYHPVKDAFLEVPKDGRSWELIQKAAVKMKHPEIVAYIVRKFNEAVEDPPLTLPVREGEASGNNDN